MTDLSEWQRLLAWMLAKAAFHGFNVPLYDKYGDVVRALMWVVEGAALPRDYRALGL